MTVERVPLDAFAKEFSQFTELSSVAIGGRVLSVSDDFFAEAFHLLLVEPAPSLKGQFGPKGALYSGWESRRHNPAYDWCIIRLGTSGSISGFDIDTSHFNGNEAPEVSVDILSASPSEEPGKEDARWVEVLPKQALGPNSRHLFRIPETTGVNFVKLNMYPDGGIARFRVYGNVIPVYPQDPAEVFDLAHVFAGGRVEFTSDQHFGVGSNLILPGRGKDMGDGWETKRSRHKGHEDWAIIRLGAPGALEQVEIDTAHFKGNFPESCELHALTAFENIDWTNIDQESYDWVQILPRTKLGPHRQHYFQLENVEGRQYTHVKVTIHPDGGIKRVRVLGAKGEGKTLVSKLGEAVSGALEAVAPTTNTTPPVKTIPVLPLTPEAFASFGQVIQAYEDHNAVPKGTKITPANQGSASKFHKLSLLASSYPEEMGATAGLSVYRCNPLQHISSDGSTDLTIMERHPFTNQAFIPMGKGREEGLLDPGTTYLVVVAHNGADDRPDVQTVRAFIASASQGIVYKTAVWHQPMTVLGKAMDFACVETQVGDGRSADCEIVELERAELDASVSKKRILTGSNGAPYVNGSVTEDEESPDLANLEMFRKEAIFRRMRHYSREYDRSQSRIAELERRRNTCEAGLAAMAACWTQLVEAIRAVAKPEELPQTTPNTRDIFDISSHISEDDAPDLVSALEDNMQVTQSLVTKFVNLGGGSQISGGDGYVRLQKAQTECVALKSEIQVLSGKLRDSETQKYELHEKLVVAETAADRLRSKTVQDINPHPTTASVQPATEEQRKPSSPVQSLPPTPVINGHGNVSDSDDHKFLADLRGKQVEELNKEVADLTARNSSLTLDSKNLPAEVVTESPHYKVLMDHASYLLHTLSEAQQENNRLSDELQAALDSRKEWQDAVEAAANESNKELKVLIGKRDAENARLRDQREQQAAELNERKQRDNLKFASIKELEKLAEARSARISVLESQLSSHKAQLAANAGNEDLMRFFFSGNLNDGDYVEQLKNRVSDAEQRAAAFEQTLSIFQDDHPKVVQHMEAEANALQRLASVTAKLENYQQIYGNLSSLAPDTAQLVERVREQEEEIKRLRLKDEQHVKEKTSVYSELEQLSGAWEALNQQAQSKVFELKDMEDRVAKCGLDKAKSDNKFFAAMRDKEAIENERKNLVRNQEKQGKIVERLVESERNLTQQVLGLDKDLVQVRRQYEIRAAEISGCRKEIRELLALQEAEASKLTNAKILMTEREKELREKKAELAKMSEELAVLKKQIEKQAAYLQERTTTGSSSSREADLEKELKQAVNVVKCGACQGTGFRDTMLRQCGHTFCRPCIEARVSTRQRKCPACNLAFSVGEIQAIYLQ
ncbi:putative allantoicase [Favolaschia claudopus]|uniref:Allantoicase n=1 Tax=Favolaschia claudopus TaxID=2862362 RepID=A0AAW0A9C0_9AGAR